MHNEKICSSFYFNVCGGGACYDKVSTMTDLLVHELVKGDDVTIVERKKIDKVMASTVFRRIRTSTSRRQSRWERESVRTRTAAGKFYDIDSMPKMPLYANTFLGWKDKKVRENITVNNKNITLNGKNITVKVTQMQKCI